MSHGGFRFKVFSAPVSINLSSSTCTTTWPPFRSLGSQVTFVGYLGTAICKLIVSPDRVNETGDSLDGEIWISVRRQNYFWKSV